ncbi:response regulator [bacterium]|nr:response regulator [bacterium]
MIRLRRDSMVWRLLALLGGGFALTALLVFLLVEIRVGAVLAERGREVYGSRVEAIASGAAREADRLDLTGDPDAYRADFQEQFLRRVAEVHHVGDLDEGFPFLIDEQGRVLVHPEFARGTPLPDDLATSILAARDERGSFTREDADGETQFLAVRPVPVWGWTVVQQVPMHVVTADADRIERELLVAWAIATILVLVVMAAVLRREVRPLMTLTEAADSMADGDLDRDIDTTRPGEVGVLARGFAHMRDAIRRQLGELRESESRYRQIFDAGTEGLLLLDEDGGIVAANPVIARMYGWSQSYLVGRSVDDLLPEDDDGLLAALRTPPADRPLRREGITIDREGRRLDTQVSAIRLSFHGRNHALVALRDITEQRQLENQLQQSQKLESVGRLAGGIAHDFNNLLTPVLGYSEMLLDDPRVPETAHGDLQAIRRAGERARTLAQQLLAFSRRQVLEMQEINLGAIVRDFEPILRRTLREDIDLDVHCNDGDCRVHADPGQIEQIVMNLVINALDAMPDSGRVLIVADCVEIDADGPPRAAHLASGTYCRLTVRDTGSGVPDDLIEHVFEPFFTTKEVGKGTGLGLSTIHGIVNQHGGAVDLRNHPEGGCEVSILLPCHPHTVEPAPPAVEQENGEVLRGRGETIWLVEDEVMVRDLVAQLLGRYGYVVRSFESGAACLAALDGGVPPEVLLTDVVMPGMSGPELRDRFEARGLTIPTLFMSGHPGETLVHRGLATAHTDFIHKPIDTRHALQKLRRMLDAAPTRVDRD